MKFVNISYKDYSFEIQTTPVTQGQWIELTNNNPSKFKLSMNHPVENVNYYECLEFINKLNELDIKYVYRLPTEEEWEYCCKAGSTTDYYFGNDKSELDRYAWYVKNSKQTTQPVGLLLPNAFGLYDMSGNVWEWTSTQYGSPHVLRGGSWDNSASLLRSAGRFFAGPGYRRDVVGFRLVRTISKIKIFNNKLNLILSL